MTFNQVDRKAAHNTGLAKVAVQCTADTFVFNQSLVLRINICAEIPPIANLPNVSRNPIDDRADTRISDFEQTLGQLKRHDNITN
jgi:hypothetical protein